MRIADTAGIGIHCSHFEDNDAGERGGPLGGEGLGGAVAILGASGTVKLTNNEYLANDADYGGAVAVTGWSGSEAEPVLLSNELFGKHPATDSERNTAELFGGGLYVLESETEAVPTAADFKSRANRASC
jgi:hypothetical protein